MLPQAEKAISAETALIQRIEGDLHDLKQGLNKVVDSLSELKTDVAVVKTQSQHMLNIIDTLNRDHAAHKEEVKKRLTDHEDRLIKIETKQVSWKLAFTVLASALTVAGGLVVGIVKIYEALSK